MKFTYSIECDEAEERDAASQLRTILDGPGLRAALWEIDQWLRGEIKYADQPYQPVRDKLHELLDERNITLDD